MTIQEQPEGDRRRLTTVAVGSASSPLGDSESGDGGDARRGAVAGSDRSVRSRPRLAFRPGVAASQLGNGEAQTRVSVWGFRMIEGPTCHEGSPAR